MLSRSYSKLAVVLLPFLGCSSSSTSPGVSVDGGTDGSSSDAGTPTSLTIVEQESPTTPIPGAIMNLDYGDGTSELETAGADGVVSFTSASRASGVLDLSAGVAGRIVTTIMAPDLPKYESKGLQLTLRGAAATAVPLTGTITNKNAPDDRLALSTTLPATRFDQTLLTYSLKLPPNEPFTLVGTDYSSAGSGRSGAFTVNKWFHVDHAALTGPTTFDIDVSAQAADTATTVSGTIVIPAAASTSFKSTCKMTVTVYGVDLTKLAFTAQVGMFVTATLSADQASFAYTAQYITLPGITPFTILELDASDGSGSQRILQGPPTDALTTSDFDVPLSIDATLGAGSTVDGTAVTDPTFLIVSAGSEAAWTVVLVPGKTSTLPTLPAAFKTIIGTAKLSGYLDTCSYFDADAGVPGVCTHQTFSKPATINL